MKTWVMIPTYNEKENIGIVISKILDLKIKGLSIVVVDDNSPDGTAKEVEKIGKKNVLLLLRTKNKGRGSAGKDGFLFCLQKGADIVLEMDADMSHNPKYIPQLIQETQNADLILGSRRVSGSKEVGRGFIRRFITWGANLYITIMLGIKVKDCNSGYRCFKRKVLEGIKVEKLQAVGPAIVQEVLYKAHLKGFKIKEIPITFVDRKVGESKLGLPQLAAGYWMVMKLKFLHLIGEL